MTLWRTYRAWAQSEDKSMKKLTCVIVILLAADVFAGNANGQVTFQRLLDSSKEPQNWLTYSGDYAGRRFSALDQINKGNAQGLTPKWVHQTMATDRFETTPLVVDGVLYGTGPDKRAFALDARTGRPIWQY